MTAEKSENCRITGRVLRVHRHVHQMPVNVFEVTDRPRQQEVGRVVISGPNRYCPGEPGQDDVKDEKSKDECALRRR